MKKSFNPKKLSAVLGISIEDFETSFDDLKQTGLIFTKAKHPEDFGRKKLPFRIVGKPPVSPSDARAVSFGPFAIRREVYERAKETIESLDSFKAYLGLLRLIFEKTGGAIEGYKFEATEEKLAEFISTIGFWDVERPVICDHYVWILPNEECKKIVESITGKKYKKDDFSWWDVKIDLGEGFTPSTISDYPEQYGLIPNELIDNWARYLPTMAWHATMHLYQKITRNNNLNLGFQNINHLIAEIKEGMNNSGAKTEKANDTLVDRELLAKELCDLNSLTYPVNETTMLEFLQQIGFILVSQSKGKITYSLAKILPLPKRVLKIPRTWEQKMDKFVASGTILFAYLNTDEIVERQG